MESKYFEDDFELPIGNSDEIDRSQELLNNDEISYADLNNSFYKSIYIK